MTAGHPGDLARGMSPSIGSVRARQRRSIFTPPEIFSRQRRSERRRTAACRTASSLSGARLGLALEALRTGIVVALDGGQEARRIDLHLLRRPAAYLLADERRVVEQFHHLGARNLVAVAVVGSAISIPAVIGQSMIAQAWRRYRRGSAGIAARSASLASAGLLIDQI